MLLSVCLITKNEQRFLEGCLASVAGIADEIVLVDTGSTDATCEIARSFSCRILHHEWSHDYAAARNVGIAAARGRWILCIDADERLHDASQIRLLIQNAAPAVGGYLIERHDLVTDPEDGRTHVLPVGIVRLFRKHPEIRYIGSVHERPGETILNAGLEIHVATTIKLSHLVQELTPERLKAKQEYYLGLLDGELQKNKNDFWAEYYRGKTLWYLQRLSEAKASFERVASTEGSPRAMRAWALNSLGALLSENGDWEGALQSVQASLRLCPSQSFAYCILGEIFYRMRRFDEAADAFGRVRLSLDPKLTKDQVHGDLYMTVERQAYKIGCCRLAQGKLQEGSDWFRRGLQSNTADAGCYYALALIAEQMGDRERAFALAGAAKLNDPKWQEPRELLERLRMAAPLPASASRHRCR
jgi:tetratricopeptide (TPR) repeat protein